METAPWFEAEGFRDSRYYAGLDDAQRRQVEAFRENGYLVLDEVGIDHATLDAAVAALEQLGPGSDYMRGGRVQDAWRRIDPVARIATAPRVLETLRLLYQREPLPFQTLNFRVGTQQRAHSDTVHFNTLPHGFMCGVWVALEDTDGDNGPLFYHPGSQRLPVFHMHDFGLRSAAGLDARDAAARYRDYEDHVERTLADSPYAPRQAHLRKGQAFIWSANIFHGGSPRQDMARTRLSQVTHFYFPGCVYYTPFLSDPLEQRWTLRRVADIRSRRMVPDYGGVERPTRLRSLVRRMLRGR